MSGFRRLASCALVLSALQILLLLAAPVSTCCPSRDGTARSAAEDECCPPGTHAPGHCPLHRAASRVCRMACDAPHGAEFLLGAIGVLPTPSPASVVLTLSRLAPVSRDVPAAHVRVPDPPPPRTLAL